MSKHKQRSRLFMQNIGVKVGIELPSEVPKISRYFKVPKSIRIPHHEPWEIATTSKRFEIAFSGSMTRILFFWFLQVGYPTTVGDGNSNIFYSRPKNRERFPIWRAYFSIGLVQPPFQPKTWKSFGIVRVKPRLTRRGYCNCKGGFISGFLFCTIMLPAVCSGNRTGSG